MDRVIKFRAWDKDNLEMVDNIQSKIGYLFRDFLNHPQRFEVMQFTGLKDKNGKEIYEGDIIKCWKAQDTLIKRDNPPRPELKVTSGMVEGYATAVLKFDGWSFEFEQLTGSDWFFYGPDGNDFTLKYIVSPRFEWIEVIGNRWEHPNLLEVKSENTK